jgi:hypothetical protein
VKKTTLAKASSRVKDVNFDRHTGKPKTLTAFLQHPQNALRNLLAVSILLLLLTGGASADWISDLQTALESGMLSISSGGRCEITAAGNQVCFYPADQPIPGDNGLMIVNPGVAKAGATIKTTLQFQVGSIGLLMKPPLAKFVVTDAASKRVDWGTYPAFSASDFAGCELGCSKQFVETFYVGTSLPAGTYTITAQMVSADGTAMSTADQGTFTITSSGTGALTCTKDKCLGAFQVEKCINKGIVSTRSCQDGTKIADGKACNTYVAQKIAPVGCCGNSDCASGQTCSSSNTCSGTSTKTTLPGGGGTSSDCVVTKLFTKLGLEQMEIVQNHDYVPAYPEKLAGVLATAEASIGQAGARYPFEVKGRNTGGVCVPIEFSGVSYTVVAGKTGDLGTGHHSGDTADDTVAPTTTLSGGASASSTTTLMGVSAQTQCANAAGVWDTNTGTCLIGGAGGGTGGGTSTSTTTVLGVVNEYWYVWLGLFVLVLVGVVMYLYGEGYISKGGF